MPSVLSEALIKSNDKQRFEIGIRAAPEVLSLAATLDMKNFLRELVSFELFYIPVPALEAVCAFGRNKLRSVFTKMKPPTAVIHHVSSSDFFMRMSNKESCRSEEHTSELQSRFGISYA